MHTLQTGWCFYAGLESAKRSNVWLASPEPGCPVHGCCRRAAARHAEPTHSPEAATLALWPRVSFAGSLPRPASPLETKSYMQCDQQLRTHDACNPAMILLCMDQLCHRGVAIVLCHCCLSAVACRLQVLRYRSEAQRMVRGGVLRCCAPDAGIRAGAARRGGEGAHVHALAQQQPHPARDAGPPAGRE